MLSAIQSNIGYKKNSEYRPSFGAIHPTRYFVKWDDSYFYQATEKEVIKNLKRLVVSLLNKNFNNKKRGVCPPAKPSKAWKKKNDLVQRISRFFINRDSDYSKRNEVRAFSRYNESHKPECYILTGRDIFIADDEGKKVGRVSRAMKEMAEDMSDSMGISIDEARASVESEMNPDLKLAKMNYFDNVEAQIREILSVSNPANSPFDAYFVAKKKGDNYIYELVDAKINGR